MIQVDHLTKRYGRRVVVDGFSFTVPDAAVTGFLGPNGAGKSTTLRIILGLTRPDTGSARIDGQLYCTLRHPLSRVGAVLETATGHRSLTASGHLRWIAQSNGITSRRVPEVLATVGLSGAAKQRIGSFSLGMGQRLGIAAALLGDPPVLILDEPVNGLDPEGIRWLRQLLRRMAAEGRTVLISSHLMGEVSMIADHLVIVNRGKLIADTAMVDFVRRHGRSFVRVRTPDPRGLARALELHGADLTSVPDGALEVGGLPGAEISRIAAAAGILLEELSTHSASLEDSFMTVISANAGRADG